MSRNHFLQKWGFENFQLTTFSKKNNNIFQNNVKNNAGGGGGKTTIFERTWRRMTNMNITFSVGNGVRNTVFKFFLQKNPYRLKWKPKNKF